jgi:hypothetical protein
MSVDAPKPAAVPAIDYAEHTLEIPTWSAKHLDRKTAAAKAKEISSDDDTVVLAELTPKQVDELLSKQA